MDDTSIVIVTDKENKEKVSSVVDRELTKFIPGTSQDASVKINWHEQSKVPDQTNAEARENVTEQPEENAVCNQEQQGSHTQESFENQAQKAKTTNQASQNGSTKTMSVGVNRPLTSEADKHKKVKIALIIDADRFAEYEKSFLAWKNVSSNFEKMTQHTVMANQQMIILIDLEEIHGNATEKGVKAVFFAVRDVFLKEEKLSVELFLFMKDIRLAASLKPVFMTAMEPGDMTSKKRPTLTVGRLAQVKADVLVNTTSLKLELNQGAVSKSLLKEAGKDIQKECNTKYPQGIKHGEIAETDAGNIKGCKAIYHGALQIVDEKGLMEIEQKYLLNFVYMCLQRAAEAGHGSIAFPAVGAGKLGYKPDMVAKAMFDAVETFYLKKPSSKMFVTFVLFEGDRKVIQHFYAEEVLRDYELKSRGGQSNVLRFHLKEELLVQVIQGDLKDYKGTDEVFVFLEEGKSWDFLKKLQMTLSGENRVKNALHHSKTTTIITHELGRCPLTVWVYNGQKFSETFKKILKKKDSLHVFIPSTDLVKNTGLKLSWKYGQKGFASQLVTCLKDTKKLDGSLYTMTIVVPSESLFKEFSQQSKSESTWLSWIPGFGTSGWSPEMVDRSSIPTVGAINITASDMDAVTGAYKTVMKKISETLYPIDTKESGGALASSIDEEFVHVGSEVDNLNSNEQEDEAGAFLFIPVETDQYLLETLMKEKLTVKGLLKPNQLYHPDHQVIVFESPSDAAQAKESLAKFKSNFYK
ncbi:uncharacterized protein LOC124265429 [Haliotis rubra]|uniref:uncharacterized protein LOC124265429 n=1 Tax=Haliotis rubra TaxID=36100 RepID=UPI001EE550D2|nr:uncharacterized protein LOC124265429 [Haliotis rubra]